MHHPDTKQGDLLGRAPGGRDGPAKDEIGRSPGPRPAPPTAPVPARARPLAGVGAGAGGERDRLAGAARGAGEGRADVELVTRIAECDEWALGALHDRFAPTLLAICARILGSQGEAEDVVQEVFLQVWRQASRYDPGRSSVSGWLALIARSRAIDRLRTRRVTERVAADAHAEDPRPHASPEGLRHVFLAERRARVAEALAELPPEQREVIELAFFRGLTQNEIAVETGTPLGTVKTRTLLAMKKLRKALEPELGDLL